MLVSAFLWYDTFMDDLMKKSEKILVSACLAGEPCRYDGRANPHPQVIKWVQEGRAIPVCPEQAGGLPTPRLPCEIMMVSDVQKVYNVKNEDCTLPFVEGAQYAFALARKHGCQKAVLKAKSPSCGYGQIYDGSFSGTLVKGIGITAALLEEKGITVMTEESLPEKPLNQEAFMENKIKLGVVFGGQSGEHEVSRVSAYNVLQVINTAKYDITCIGITKQGVWMIYKGPYTRIKDGSWEQDDENLKKEFSLFHDPEITGIDIFYPILHGPMGEDGTIQGVFEMMGKPYVGCGVLASSVGMDKVVSKILFESAGIPVTPYVCFKKRQWDQNQDAILTKIEEKLGYPAFVKPVNMGSSVGISKAHNQDELVAGIIEALRYDQKILVEAFIDGREIECAVLEDEGIIKTTIPGEVVASKEFYDYEAKYSDDQDSEVIIPAPISEALLNKVREYAAIAFEAIDGSGLSRVDFFVTRGSGEIIINEVNTLPGFTNISMYPKMWENMGMDYAELVEKIICSAGRKRDTEYTLI